MKTDYARKLADKIREAIQTYMRAEGLTLLSQDDLEIIERALDLTEREFLG